MKDLLAKWSRDVKKASAFQGRTLLDKCKASRLRDIHRAFHRGFDFKRTNIDKALKLENEIVSKLFWCDFGKDSHSLDDLLLQSETFLYDLPQHSQSVPNWVLCWHYHMLARAAFAHRAKEPIATEAIKKALVLHPLPTELDDEAKSLVAKLHAELELKRPRYAPYSKRFQILTALALDYEREHNLTTQIKEKLDYRKVSSFVGEKVDDLKIKKRLRNRFSKRVVSGFWHSYLVRTEGKLCIPLFFQHLEYNAWMLKARYSVASELMYRNEFPWGPGMSSSLAIRSLMNFWRWTINRTVTKEARSSWNIIIELFDVTRKLLRNLKGETLNTFRAELENKVMPLFSKKHIFYHLFTTRLILEEPQRKNDKRSTNRAERANPHTKAALEIAMNSIRKAKSLENWTEGQWKIIRRVCNLRYAVLHMTKDFAQLDRESDFIIDTVDNYTGKKGTLAVFHLRDYSLLATLMKISVLEHRKEALPQDILDKLTHAEKHRQDYDTGRRKSALFALERHR